MYYERHWCLLVSHYCQVIWNLVQVFLALGTGCCPGPKGVRSEGKTVLQIEEDFRDSSIGTRKPSWNLGPPKLQENDRIRGSR